MSKPLAKTPGPIDSDAIAWAVREVLIGQITGEVSPMPAVSRSWAIAVKLTACAVLLSGLWQIGAALGWN